MSFLLVDFIFLPELAKELLNNGIHADIGKVVLPMIFPIAGAGMTTHAFVSRLAFSETALVQISFRSRKSLPYASIRGRREFVVSGNTAGSTRYLQLEPSDNGSALVFGKKLQHSMTRSGGWFNALPDLDAMDKAAKDSGTHTTSNFGLV
jgi:hypothetical protein